MQSSSPGRVGTRRPYKDPPAPHHSQARGGALQGGPEPGKGAGRGPAGGPGAGRRHDGVVTAGTRPSISPYAVFDRESWRALAAGSELPLDEAGLRSLTTLGDRIDIG